MVVSEEPPLSPLSLTPFAATTPSLSNPTSPKKAQESPTSYGGSFKNPYAGERDYAVKVILKKSVKNQLMLDLIAKEIKLLRDVAHPYI